MNDIKTLNFKIVIPVLILFALSLVTISGVSEQLVDYGEIEDPTIFIMKQTFGMIAGSIGAYIIYKSNLKKLLGLINLAYWILFGMLFILFTDPPIIGDIFVKTINGANGWFVIPIVGITIQPVEFMKVALIFKLAVVSKSHIESERKDKDLIKKYLIFGLVPIIMVLLQPDLGGAILLLFPSLFMFLYSVKNKKLVKILVISMLSSIAVFIGILFIPGGLEFLAEHTPIEMYQLERLTAWLYPFDYDKGLQLQQSLILIGSAGLFGHGYGYSGIHLPEPHTDVIFSEFTGMFGIIAGAFLIFLYFYLINEFFSVTLKTNDLLFKLVAFGFSMLFLIQVTENIGMMLGLLPITGIVLPFMSYGVSAMVTYLSIIGVFLNIHKNSQ
jgi:rod shape determining protein RodA